MKNDNSDNKWLASHFTRSGENISASRMNGILSRHKQLKKAFPPAERAFCKVVDCLHHRLPVYLSRLIRYQRQKPFKITEGITFYGDFYFKTIKLLVEIDGQSHCGQYAKERDEWRTRLIAGESKMTCLRLTNDEVTGGDWRSVEDKFLSAIRKSHVSRNLVGKIKKLCQVATQIRPMRVGVTKQQDASL